MDQKYKYSSRQPGFSYIGKYKVLQFLGKGGTAKVKLAQCTQTGKSVALKIFRDPSESKMKIKHSLDQVTQEFKVIAHLKHINILNVVEVLEKTYYERKNGEKYLTTTIVLEYAEGGECFDYVAQFQNFSEKVARTYFHQLMRGIEYLHSNNICHRDIKMENLLFDDDFNLKIADFGFARDVQGQNGDGKLFSRLGTEGYQAAEIKEQKNYSGQKVDIFACGVVLFLFIAGRPPFEAAATNNRWYRTFQERKLDFWKFQNKYSNFPPQLCRLLDKMMHHYPERRADLKYIWDNEWVKGPTLSQKELKQEMSVKLAQLQKKQEEERQKKKMQKMKAQEELRKKKQHEMQYQQDLPIEGQIGQIKIFRGDDNLDVERNLVVDETFELFSDKLGFTTKQLGEKIFNLTENMKEIQHLPLKTQQNQIIYQNPTQTIKAFLPIIHSELNCLNFQIISDRAKVIVAYENKQQQEKTIEIKFSKFLDKENNTADTFIQFFGDKTFKARQLENHLLEKLNAIILDDDSDEVQQSKNQFSDDSLSFLSGSKTNIQSNGRIPTCESLSYLN